MAQQPLSAAIKNLENELGFDLFERVSNRIHLSAAGGAFLEEAREVLAAADRAVERGRPRPRIANADVREYLPSHRGSGRTCGARDARVRLAARRHRRTAAVPHLSTRPRERRTRVSRLAQKHRKTRVDPLAASQSASLSFSRARCERCWGFVDPFQCATAPYCPGRSGAAGGRFLRNRVARADIWKKMRANSQASRVSVPAPRP